MNEIFVANRQTKIRIDSTLVKATARIAFDHLKIEQCSLSIAFLASRAMAEANMQYLSHEGPTDVITFGYEQKTLKGLGGGEILICPDEALRQSQAFGSSLGSETARYIIHGILHLAGFDDLDAVKRKIMKRNEHFLLKKAESSLHIKDLARLRHE